MFSFPPTLGKVGKARASFRQSFRFGSMNIRDRGLRLAGYLTPPSDITQEDDDGHDKFAAKMGTSLGVKAEKPPWTQLSAPALVASHTDIEREAANVMTDEIRIHVPIMSKVRRLILVVW